MDLPTQYLAIKAEIDNAMADVLSSGSFIMGDKVLRFESEIAQYLGVKHAIGVANGSDAIHLSLLALGIGPGDEVIVPSFTFFATAGAVARAGATPVFADIEPVTFNIDPRQVEGRITERTRAIIPVHLYGQPADMDPLLQIARRHNLRIVEDAAQAIGAEHKGRKVGTIGDTACFSFFPTKNLGAFGDGGMITTNDDELAERLRLLRVHGSRIKYHHEILGYNSRLDAIQAAILLVKLRHLPSWTKARQAIAAGYRKAVGELGLESIVHCPPEPRDCVHVYHQFTVRVDRREALRGSLRETGIETAVYYPLPLHLQPVFSNLGYSRGDLPVSEGASEVALSLPIYPELETTAVHDVIAAISAYYRADGGNR